METRPRGLRQSMTHLHIWVGLLAGWILYAMFLTGTVCYFRAEISQYMRPELHATRPLPLAAAETVERVARHIFTLAPTTPLVSIDPPIQRGSLASAFWRNPGKKGGFETGVFDPVTGQKLHARDTEGGGFFRDFHFSFHYIPRVWGYWIATFCAMFMLVSIISGVIAHKKIFKDFFTFRWGKGQRSWLDAHNAFAVLGLPFHFMIAYSGLITLMLTCMPWGLHTLSSSQRVNLINERTLFLPVDKPSDQSAPLTDIASLIQQAEQRWGKGSVGRIQINNAGDSNARIGIARQQSRQVSITPRYLLFDGTNGKLLKVKDSSGVAATVQGTLYGLHMGRFADTIMRWLYFLISLGGTAMVGTGLALWTVKRRAKLPDPNRPDFGFRLVERLNIAAIAGLSVAMTAFFWGNRLLPLDTPQRSDWEISLFFIVWAAALLYALWRPAKRAWIELFWLAAALLALLPLLNAITTDRPLWKSITHGDWVFAGFECTVLVFALLHAGLAIGIARHKPRRGAQRLRQPSLCKATTAIRETA